MIFIITKSEFIPKCIREVKGQLYQHKSENKMVGVNLLYGREGFPYYMENLKRKKRIHLFPLKVEVKLLAFYLFIYLLSVS